MTLAGMVLERPIRIRPVAVMLIVTTLALHRVLRAPSRGNSLLAFSSLGTIVLMRGTFHLVFYVGVFAAVVMLRRKYTRILILGALLPSLLVAALYVKHRILFGEYVVGGFYRGVNLSMMQMRQMDAASLADLRKSGRISAACPGGFNSHIDLTQLLRAGGISLPPQTGVPILDLPWKSTGATNWASTQAEVVGRECSRAGEVLRKAAPLSYEKAVWENLNRYSMPADRSWPFLREGMGNNADKLRTLNHTADTYLGLQIKPNQVSITVCVGLVISALAPLIFIWRQLLQFRARKKLTIYLPTSAVVAAFSLGTLIYTALVVILYSVGDHNRYRAEVMPLIWLVDTSACLSLVRLFRRRARRKTATPTLG